MDIEQNDLLSLENTSSGLPAVAPPVSEADSQGAPEEEIHLTPQEAQFLDEEAKIIKALDECRFNYLIGDLKIEDVSEEELKARRETYEKALHSLIFHRCNYAVSSGDTGVETRTMGEHLLEIISSTLIHDTNKRDAVCGELDDDKLGNRIRKFIETRPRARLALTLALGSTAVLGAHVGIFPEAARIYAESVGAAADALGAALGTFTYLDRKRRRAQMLRHNKELEEQESAMLGDSTATERFVGFLSDYVSRPHHDYFIDKVHRAQGHVELEKIIDELEEAIERQAAHRDVRDVAELVKRHFREILSDGGLLEQLEKDSNSNETHKQLILAILAKELETEETDRDALSGKIGLVAAATIGMMTLGGGAAFGYHPIESPLPEERDSKDKDYE